MFLPDHYAYTNRLVRVPPGWKAGLALVVLVLCLGLNKPAVGLLAMLGMGILAVVLAGIPARVFVKLLFGEGIFLFLVVAGVAVSINLAPAAESNWCGQLGPLYLSTTPASLDTALHLFTRALGGVAGMNFLALTTPMTDFLELLRRLKVPVFLLDISAITYRFIFVLLECLGQIRTAQDCRLGYSNTRRSFHSTGILGSRLFIEAYRHSQQLQTALESRGYTGDLKVLPLLYRRDKGFMGAGLVIVAGLLAAGAFL